MGFQIDERILSTCVFLGKWPLSNVYLKNMRDYPWLILLPRVAGVTEIYELSRSEQYQLMDEISAASNILEQIFHPDKLNVAALGNIVTQLHVHVLARRLDDALWPQSIWQAALVEQAYASAPLNALLEKLKPIVAQAFQIA